MNIDLNNLLPYDELENDLSGVFKEVDEKGKIVLLKNNRPAYIIQKFNSEEKSIEPTTLSQLSKHTLQDAMHIVLSESENKELHASILADEIYNKRLYFKKDGTKAEYNQIRARCGHYPHMFEALPGNIIRLKEKRND